MPSSGNGEPRVSGRGPSVRAVVEVPTCSGEDPAGAGLRACGDSNVPASRLLRGRASRPPTRH